MRDRVRQIQGDPHISSALRGSFGVENLLLACLNELLNRDLALEYTEWDRNNLIARVNNFELVLASELSVSDAYFVVEKRGYSTLRLVSEGEVLFPPDLPHKLPLAVHDLREAGKCIAFELGTAAGFHLLRAVEAVLRRYWEITTGHAPKPKQRNLGVYLDAMRRNGCGDPKVIAALAQIKDLHRNVIMHPEENLDIHDAVSLMGIANSAMAAMLKALPVIATEAPEPEDQSFPLFEDGEAGG